MPLSTQAWSICCPARMCCGLLLIQHYLSLVSLIFPTESINQITEENLQHLQLLPTIGTACFSPGKAKEEWWKQEESIRELSKRKGDLSGYFKKHLHSCQLVTDAALQGTDKTFLTTPFKELDKKLHWALGKERYRRLRNEDLQEYKDLAEICMALF